MKENCKKQKKNKQRQKGPRGPEAIVKVIVKHSKTKL